MKQGDELQARFVQRQTVSLMKGRMGVSHTTVGIPRSCIRSSTSIRRFVLHT